MYSVNSAIAIAMSEYNNKVVNIKNEKTIPEVKNLCMNTNMFIIYKKTDRKREIPSLLLMHVF